MKIDITKSEARAFKFYEGVTNEEAMEYIKRMIKIGYRIYKVVMTKDSTNETLDKFVTQENDIERIDGHYCSAECRVS